MADRTGRPPPSPFTAEERELIRREMGVRFGQPPRVADGLFLRAWRGGERRGEPRPDLNSAELQVLDKKRKIALLPYLWCQRPVSAIQPSPRR